jgi:RNA polymerase sigma-70 factor (ECF subfamily)
MGVPAGQRTVQRLVEDHYAALYRYAYRLTGTAGDAEDLTQDTFCQAQLKLRQLRDKTRVKGWLFSILRHAYLHRQRSRKHEPTVSLDGVAEPVERPTEPLPEVDPQQLQHALNEMPEEFRTPIILYFFEEFTYRDIAEHMEVPLGTVMSRLARAKAHLRARLLPLAGTALAEGARRATDGL